MRSGLLWSKSVWHRHCHPLSQPEASWPRRARRCSASNKARRRQSGGHAAECWLYVPEPPGSCSLSLEARTSLPSRPPTSHRGQFPFPALWSIPSRICLPLHHPLSLILCFPASREEDELGREDPASGDIWGLSPPNRREQGAQAAWLRRGRAGTAGSAGCRETLSNTQRELSAFIINAQC